MCAHPSATWPNHSRASSCTSLRRQSGATAGDAIAWPPIARQVPPVPGTGVGLSLIAHGIALGRHLLGTLAGFLRKRMRDSRRKPLLIQDAFRIR
ncbi:MAG: hypothetical protein C4345_05995 [Chloroflexota bacterium]